MTGRFKRNIKLTLKFIRLALISGVVFIITLLIAAMILTYIYRNEVINMMIQSLNQHIKTEIHVDNVQLDLLRRFPNASVTLDNVVVFEVSQEENRDILLESKRIYFQFSIADLIKKNYTIKHLEISGGSFNPVDHSDGTNNYVFWHTREDDQPSTDFSFDLQRIDLKDFSINYANNSQNSKYNIYSKTSKISGKFSQQDYMLNINSTLKINNLLIDNKSLMYDKDVDLDLAIAVENNKLYRFDKGLIELSGNTFETNGFIETVEKSNYFDLTINGKNIELNKLINDLPHTYKNYFEDYRSNGKLFFDAIIKGHSSRAKNPRIIAEFGLQNGSLNNRSRDLFLDEVSFDGRFDNGLHQSMTTSELIFENISAIVNNGKITGQLSITDLIKPKLRAGLNSSITAIDLINLLDIEYVDVVSGDLLISLDYEGKIDNWNSSASFIPDHLIESKTSGKLELTNLSFTIKENSWEYEDLNGSFNFINNNLAIESFNGLISGNDFKMDGYFLNIIPYLFDDSQRMVIDASFVSNNLDIDKLLRKDKPGADEAIYKLEFSDRVDFNLWANIGNFNLGKFNASDLTGTLHMNNQKFAASDIIFNAMSGTVEGNAYIDGTTENLLRIGCDAKLKNIDTHNMFYQLGNFGQESLISENIKGTIDADLQFTSNWSQNLKIDWNSLETTADIKIVNGELINFKPMMALSRYIRVEDLEHVVFSDLHNTIRISDRKIIIPDMEINSSAFNIKVSGEHTFENEIDYRLQILLSELLARKNREQRNPQEQYGDITDDGLGQTTLFLVLTGTIDDPIFRYDREGIRERLRDDLQQERKELRDIFRDEFSWIQRDEQDPITTERKEEMKRIKKQEEGFVIEFDDY